MARDCRASETYSVTATHALDREGRFWRQGTVNGGPLVGMKIDTGCVQTTIRSDLVDPATLKEGKRRTTVGNGQYVQNSLADVNIQIEGETHTIEALVSDELPVPVLLGEDLPLEKMVLKTTNLQIVKEHMEEAERGSFIVLTRSQKKLQEREEAERLAEEASAQGTANRLMEIPAEGMPDAVSGIEEEKKGASLAPFTEAESVVRPDATDGEYRSSSPEANIQEETESEDQSLELPEEATNPGAEFDFADDLFGATRESRGKLSREQRRQQSLRRTLESEEASTTLAQNQEREPEVQRWKEKEDPSRVLRKNGVLMRRWKPRGKYPRVRADSTTEKLPEPSIEDSTQLTNGRTFGPGENS